MSLSYLFQVLRLDCRLDSAIEFHQPLWRPKSTFDLNVIWNKNSHRYMYTDKSGLHESRRNFIGILRMRKKRKVTDMHFIRFWHVLCEYHAIKFRTIFMRKCVSNVVLCCFMRITCKYHAIFIQNTMQVNLIILKSSMIS